MAEQTGATPTPLQMPELLDDDSAMRRLDICRTCPELIRPEAICQACGCLMKVKVRLADATCPLGMW
jgi:ribosomal protein L32